MAYPKGAPKPAGSGRKVGSTNKYSKKTVEEILDIMGVNPIEGLAKLATNKKAPMQVQERCYTTLAKHRYPAMKAVEHTGPGGGAIQLAHQVDLTKLNDKQLADALELARFITDASKAVNGGS